MVGKSPPDAQAKVGSLRAPGERPCTAGTVTCGGALCVDGALAGGAATGSVPARGAAHSLRRRPAAVAGRPRRSGHATPADARSTSAVRRIPRHIRGPVGAVMDAVRACTAAGLCAAAQPPALANRTSGAHLAVDPASPQGSPPAAPAMPWRRAPQTPWRGPAVGAFGMGGAEIPGGAGGEKKPFDRRRAVKMRADDPAS